MSRFIRPSSGPCLVSAEPSSPGLDVISHMVDTPIQQKLTKAERVRAEIAAARQSVRVFAEGKPSRKELREYFARLIEEINED